MKTEGSFQLRRYFAVQSLLLMHACFQVQWCIPRFLTELLFHMFTNVQIYIHVYVLCESLQQVIAIRTVLCYGKETIISLAISRLDVNNH